MNSFFKAIENCDPNSESITVTVLKGPGTGEKAVITDGSLAYVSVAGGFIEQHRSSLMNLKGRGLETLDGSAVYSEKLGHTKKLAICGCGHVSMPIIRIAKMIGLHVTAIDDRPDFAENAKKAGADITISAPFDEALEEISGGPHTYFVIVTRDHRWDLVCLRSICKKPHAYIGMMGSKRRVQMVKGSLIKDGFESGLVESIHAPIGLKIGSETPEEIAVSIIAEIIAVKNEHKDFSIPEDIQRAIRESEPGSSAILATIIARSGSAPRAVGTKMLILADGSTVNTIGGGLMEAQVLEKAKKMLEDGQATIAVEHFQLLAGEKDTEGEVCGGKLDILFEKL